MPDKLSAKKLCISLDFDQRFRTEGDTVSGIARLDLELVKEKDLVELRVALKAEVHTWVSVSNGEVTTAYRGRDDLINEDFVLWSKTEAEKGLSEPQESGELSLPFSFIIKCGSKPLPPSFDAGHLWQGGRAQYFVQLVAKRRAWHQANIKLSKAFPFLPLDSFFTSQANFEVWKGSYKPHSETFKVHQNLLKVLGAPGEIDLQLRLPEVEGLPLNKPIAVFIDVTCRSRPLPMSSSHDPTKFQYPRLPKPANLTLELNRTVAIRVAGHTRGEEREVTTSLQTFSVDLDSKAKAIGTKCQWLPDYEKPDKGRWTETATYVATLQFKCPPSFETRLITSKMSLDVKLRLPGPRSDIKMTIKPINITSGIADTAGSATASLDVPENYFEIFDPDLKEKGNVHDMGYFC